MTLIKENVKMNNIRKTICAMAVAAACAVPAAAQSLNPQVEVTNAYHGKIVETLKTDVPMSLPDSLLKFDYRVDYTVFDHPYKGSYEFRPYMIEMRPGATPVSASRLYLNAGAGYTLVPTLDFAWSSKPGGKLSGTLYDDLDGWYGPMRGGFAKGYKGYVLDNRAGATGRYDGSAFKAVADIGYSLVGASDSLGSHTFHVFDASVRFGTSGDPLRKVTAHGQANVSYGHDSFEDGSPGLGVREFVAGASAGLSFPQRHYPGNLLAVDAEAEVVRLSQGADAHGMRVSVLPRYVIRRDGLLLSLGVTASCLPGNGSRGDDEAYHTSSKFLYPDLHAEWQFNKGRMTIFAHLSGGDKLDSYSTQLRANPFFTLQGWHGPDASVTRADLNLGIGGCAFRRLQYRAAWGYAVYESVLNETWSEVCSGMPAFVYSDHTTMYSDVSAAWRSYRLDVDASGRYAHSFNGIEGLRPAAFTGRFAVAWRCTDRLEASLRGRGSTKRTMSGSEHETPAWLDLGVKAEYQLTSGLSLWVSGGNLLCQDIYEYAFRARRGVSVTVGACLNIR